MLPDDLDAWVRQQASRGGHAHPGAYLVHLLRREQQWIEPMQRAITEGIESGISERSIDEILAEARRTAI